MKMDNKVMIQLQMYKDALKKIIKKLEDKRSEPYSMHCEESYFIGIYDSIKIVEECAPKE